MPGAKATLSSSDHNVSSIFDARVTKKSRPYRSRLGAASFTVVAEPADSEVLEDRILYSRFRDSEMASLQHTFQVKGETARRIHSVWYFIEAK
jgi:hypothetical protein